MAARSGHVSTIENLAPKMDSLLQKTDDVGWTMVHFAARNGHADVVQLVIDNFHLDPTARSKVCVCLNCSCILTSSWSSSVLCDVTMVVYCTCTCEDGGT